MEPTTVVFTVRNCEVKNLTKKCVITYLSTSKFASNGSTSKSSLVEGPGVGSNTSPGLTSNVEVEGTTSGSVLTFTGDGSGEGSVRLE